MTTTHIIIAASIVYLAALALLVWSWSKSPTLHDHVDDDYPKIDDLIN